MSKQCKECGSWAINHNCHGRDGSEPKLCDVCYWRKKHKDVETFNADLLAALEAINPVPGEYYYDGSSDLPGYELMRDDVSTIRAAIAKARGE